MSRVPTVPTCRQAVGTGQGVDNTHCSDRSDCSDQNREEGAENEGSLRGMVERLRLRRAGITENFSHAREIGHSERVGTSVFDPDTTGPVGTVGTVGTDNDNNELSRSDRRFDGRNSRNTPPAVEHGPSARSEPPFGEDPPPPLSENDYGAVPSDQAVPTDPTPGDPWSRGIATLERMRPLPGFTPATWLRVKRGCAVLLRGHGDELRRLGWSAEEAFGLHREVPFHGIHAWGLGPLLGDGEVVALSAVGATIRRRDGTRQSFTRRPVPDAVSIWEIDG